MNTIFEKITLKGKEAADKIALETKKEVEELLNDAKALALLEKDKTIAKTKNKITLEIAQKERSFTLDKRQAILKHKISLIDQVINELYEKLNTLTKKELLKFSLLLIKKENLTKKQTMQVNKNDYQRYLEAFSTNKASDLVILDLLNEKLDNKVEISLSNEAANINDGFLIICEDYDLNFSIRNYVDELRKKYEKEIFEILFGE